MVDSIILILEHHTIEDSLEFRRHLAVMILTGIDSDTLRALVDEPAVLVDPSDAKKELEGVWVLQCLMNLVVSENVLRYYNLGGFACICGAAPDYGGVVAGKHLDGNR